MSQYENYDATSLNYDSIRFAFGHDVIAAMLQFYSGKPLQDLHILDAGCGTGNYTKSLLELGAKKITMMDASRGMLQQSKSKLKEAIDSGKIKEVVQARLPSMPFAPSSFDAVMFNLVMHHLQQNPDGKNYPTIEETLIEARKVMKPGGVLSICTINPDGELLEKLWYVELNKDICERHKKLYPQMETWKEIFNKTGFRLVTAMDVHVSSNVDFIVNMEGPSKKEWRAGNSYWACAKPEEIEEIEKQIKTMKTNGTLEAFFKKHHRLGDHFTYTFIFAISTDI